MNPSRLDPSAADDTDAPIVPQPGQAIEPDPLAKAMENDSDSMQVDSELATPGDDSGIELSDPTMVKSDPSPLDDNLPVTPYPEDVASSTSVAPAEQAPTPTPEPQKIEVAPATVNVTVDQPTPKHAPEFMNPPASSQTNASEQAPLSDKEGTTIPPVIVHAGKKSHTVLLVIIILILLGGGAAGAYLYMQQGKQTNSNPTSSEQQQTDESKETQVATNDQQETNNQIDNDANDTEREADIRAIHAFVEAFYATNGFYPTLANLNDAAFREENLKGFDDEALVDPEDTTETLVLVAVPTAKKYAYQQNPEDCDNTNQNCTGYTLTATLSDETLYTKTALN